VLRTLFNIFYFCNPGRYGRREANEGDSYYVRAEAGGPMIPKIIGLLYFGLAVEGISLQLQPRVCTRVRSSITCSHRICTRRTGLHPKLKRYCLTGKVKN